MYRSAGSPAASRTTCASQILSKRVRGIGGWVLGFRFWVFVLAGTQNLTPKTFPSNCVVSVAHVGELGRLLRDERAHLGGADCEPTGVVAEVFGAVARVEHARYRLFNLARLLFEPRRVSEHERGRGYRAERVRDPAARDVGRGAVDGLVDGYGAAAARR